MSKKICVLISVITTFVITTALILGLLVFVTPFGDFLAVRSSILAGFVRDVDSDELDNAALYGMVDELDDPYSQYLSDEEYAIFIESLNSEYQGIGVEIYIDAEDNLVTVAGVFENTSAAEAGIRAGDKIIKINDLDISEETYAEMLLLLKSDKNVSKFEIVLLRGEEKITVNCERCKIERDTVSFKKYGETAYIKIAEFSDNTVTEFVKALEETDAQNSDGIIIDLRNNPGGFFDTAVDIADILLPECNIAYTSNKSGHKQYYNSDKHFIDVPIVLLVNENSASASEILTGALRDNLKTPVVGTRSFGKGCVQTLVPLPGKAGALRLTTSYYYSPSGVCIQDVGFTPDYEVELSEQAKKKPIGELSINEDTQLAKALEILRSR